MMPISCNIPTFILGSTQLVVKQLQKHNQASGSMYPSKMVRCTRHKAPGGGEQLAVLGVPLKRIVGADSKQDEKFMVSST